MKRISKIVSVLLFLVVFLTSFGGVGVPSVYAAPCGGVGEQACPGESGVGSTSSLCPPTGLANKLCNLTSKNINLATLAIGIINVILFVAFALALIFLIVGGIRWIISGGDKGRTEAARSGVTSALIGLAVVVGAYVLINVVLKFLGLTNGLSDVGTAPPTLF